MPTGIGGETAWWCPSLDDSGNGTTTLHDLIGSNHCTLGSSGSWVSNTASGGVRAISAGNVNTFAASWLLSGTFGISFWAYGIGSFPGPALSDGGLGWILYPFNGGNNGFVSYGATSFYETATANTRAGWHHFFVKQVSGVGQTFYVDGVSVGTASQMTLGAVNVGLLYYTYGSNTYFSGRLDDLRWFAGVAVSEVSIASLATRRAYQPSASSKPQHPMYQQVIG